MQKSDSTEQIKNILVIEGGEKWHIEFIAKSAKEIEIKI